MTNTLARPLVVLAMLLLGGCSTIGNLLGGQPAQGAAPSGGVPLEWGAPPDAVGKVRQRIEDPAYQIGPEDGLEISVWKEDNLKSTTLVRPDGGISFPLAGDFIVAGRTAAQVRDELVKRLTRFVPEPEVTVSVVRVSSYRIYVIGRVNRPGDITVGRTLDVLQALSLAGGMTPFASEDSIRIIRRVGGKSVSIPFDYTRLRKEGDLSQNITLLSGDVLLVP